MVKIKAERQIESKADLTRTLQALDNLETYATDREHPANLTNLFPDIDQSTQIEGTQLRAFASTLRELTLNLIHGLGGKPDKSILAYSEKDDPGVDIFDASLAEAWLSHAQPYATVEVEIDTDALTGELRVTHPVVSTSPALVENMSMKRDKHRLGSVGGLQSIASGWIHRLFQQAGLDNSPVNFQDVDLPGDELGDGGKKRVMSVKISQIKK